MFRDKGEFVCPQCKENILHEDYSHSETFLQLSYFKRLFNFEKWMAKINSEMKAKGEIFLIPEIRNLVLSKLEASFDKFFIYIFFRRRP